MSGRILKHYHLLEQIGEGGMGVVHGALDTRLDRRVAIKMLKPEVSSDPVLQARLRKEATAAARIQHPGVCTIHEIDQEDGVDFIVMEFVAGPPLSLRLSNGPMPVADSLDVALQVAEALDAAHENGVIHRDLKPHNILAHGRTFKITDFGIAQLEPRSTDITAARLTGPNSAALGTLDYMAWEQLSGGVADVRTDLFSLGVVLFQMLTGKLPFSGADRDHHGSLPDGLPARLNKLCEQLLAREKAARPESARAVGSELRAIGQLLTQPSRKASRGATLDERMDRADHAISMDVREQAAQQAKRSEQHTRAARETFWRGRDILYHLPEGPCTQIRIALCATALDALKSGKPIQAAWAFAEITKHPDAWRYPDLARVSGDLRRVRADSSFPAVVESEGIPLSDDFICVDSLLPGQHRVWKRVWALQGGDRGSLKVASENRVQCAPGCRLHELSLFGAYCSSCPGLNSHDRLSLEVSVPGMKRPARVVGRFVPHNQFSSSNTRKQPGSAIEFHDFQGEVEKFFQFIRSAKELNRNQSPY